MENKNDMISVCMATYNGEKYIKEQIDSILGQLKDSDELIISDDGSTDNTIDIIKQYNDSRIKLLHHKHPVCNSKYYKSNVYVTNNFENALNHCKGDYIFLSDQDDIWVDGKVDIMVNVARENGGIVMSAINVIDEYNQIKKRNILPQNYSFIKGVIAAKYLGSCMVMTRCFLNKVLPFPQHIVSHDAWLGLFATYNKELMIISQPLLLYRRHSGNVTSNSLRTSLYSKVRYRFFLFVNVLKRTYLKK